MTQLRITISPEINRLLKKMGKKLGKKPATLARELMEQKLYDLKIIQKQFEDIE